MNLKFHDLKPTS